MLAHEPAEAQAVARLQEILDPYVLVEIEINPESRVKVSQASAKPVLMEGGTRIFLAKVLNQAGVTAPLEVESPNSGPTSLRSRGEAEPKLELTEQHVKERWAEIEVYNKPPMAPRLSGLGIEYQLLQVYSRDRGQRSASIAFNVGQGTQDLGFRGLIDVLFQIRPAVRVTFRVRDADVVVVDPGHDPRAVDVVEAGQGIREVHGLSGHAAIVRRPASGCPWPIGPEVAKCPARHVTRSRSITALPTGVLGVPGAEGVFGLQAGGAQGLEPGGQQVAG